MWNKIRGNKIMKTKISRVPRVGVAVAAMLAILNAPLSTARAGTFSDDFSGGLNAFFWTVNQTQPGLYSVDASEGDVQLAKIPTQHNSGGVQSVYVSLNLSALGGAISNDFSVQIAFTNVVIPGPGLDQVELHTSFADGSIFYDVFDDGQGGFNVHVWDGGSVQGRIAMTTNAGVFSITRSGSTVTGYFNGTPMFSETRGAALTFIAFVLQNNNGSDDNISVTYDNFSLTAASVVVPQTVYDAEADFSTNSNPAGAWSWGYETNLGSALVLYTSVTLTPQGSVYWSSPLLGEVPLASANQTTNSFTSGSVAVGPLVAGMHPGPDGQYSVFRFTTPVSGEYFLDCCFFGLDFVGPTTTDVHVLSNNVSLFDGAVNSFGAASGTNFAAELTLAAGDQVDFAVGYGADGNNSYDSTGFMAQLVPGGPVPIRLVQAGRAGTNFSFSFQTVGYFNYTVEYNDDLSTTNWQTFEIMTGNGSLMQCLAPMTNTTQRFFRVHQP
jgi:hypothetical protein